MLPQIHYREQSTTMVDSGSLAVQHAPIADAGSSAGTNVTAGAVAVHSVARGVMQTMPRLQSHMEGVLLFSCSLQSEFENMTLSNADPFEIALRHVASLVKETHPRLFNQVNNFGFDLCVFYFVAFSLILNL